MSVVRNVLAVIGLLSLVVLLVLGLKIQSVVNEIESFDDRAVDIYTDFIKKAYHSGSAIDAMVYKVRVLQGVTPTDLDHSIKSIASELNIKNVGEMFLSEQVEMLSGNGYRHVKIYQLCNAMTAASILNYNDAISSFLPCRISVVENTEGELWMYTLDLDLLIHGGKSIPPALKNEIIKVRDTITQIMQRAAVGDF